MSPAPGCEGAADHPRALHSRGWRALLVCRVCRRAAVDTARFLLVIAIAMAAVVIAWTR